MRHTPPVIHLSLVLVTMVLANALAASPAAGQPSAETWRDGTLLTALRAGGFVLYFRHADTDHSQQDARTGNMEDCASQRNLSVRGREHARAIGDTIRALGIPIGAVLASPLCRTRETATLAFGSAESSLAVREAGSAPPGSPDRFVELRALLSTPSPPGKNTVIVGHAYPLYSLIGGQYLEEGEAAVIRPGSGGFNVVVRVGLKEWRELQSLSR